MSQYQLNVLSHSKNAAETCSAFYNSVQQTISKPESKLSFVYHTDNTDYVESNGVILSMKKC